MAQVNDPESGVKKVADNFSMVFTPFHGTGYKLIPEALKRMGMKHVICVPQQMVIDGDFPTVASPSRRIPRFCHRRQDGEGTEHLLHYGL